MDHLRALQYFVVAAQELSFSRAARRLEVSMPAVSKLVAALERDVGSVLFERSPLGLALTPNGARYLDRCRPLLQELQEARNDLRAMGMGARGTVVVGMPAERAHASLGPALPEFHARFPNIDLDIRSINRITDPGAEAVDVFVLFNWDEAPQWITKVIAQARYAIVASPSYCSRHGMPKEPRDLLRHACLVYRSAATLLDVWEFQRNRTIEKVTVRGWLASGSRALLLDMALAGEGVLRTTNLTLGEELSSGRLVRLLPEWTPRHAPPVTLLFRPTDRKTARIRVFVDFVSELFRRLGAEFQAAPGADARARPAWWGKGYSRLSRTRA